MTGLYLYFFSSRRRHTRCALVTGGQTCALPIYEFGTRKCRIVDRDAQIGVTIDLGRRIAETLAVEDQQSLAPGDPALNVGGIEHRLSRTRGGGDELFVTPDIARRGQSTRPTGDRANPFLARHLAPAILDPDPLGTASVRVRVCTYVWIRVGA